jgi:hypothetical protein
MHTLTNGVTTMTEVEQLREDYRKIVARRHSAEELLLQERAKNSELMASVKFLRQEFEELERTFNAHRDGHRDDE